MRVSSFDGMLLIVPYVSDVEILSPTATVKCVSTRKQFLGRSGSQDLPPTTLVKLTESKMEHLQQLRNPCEQRAI